MIVTPQLLLPACPAAGAGVHSWILGAANRCRNAGIPAPEAARLISERMTRPPSPPNEIEVAVAKAYSSQRVPPVGLPSSRGCFPQRSAPVPLSDLKFDEARLRQTANRISKPKNWRHWLWERSPKRPEAMNAYSFLKHVFAPGEKVCVIRAVPLHSNPTIYPPKKPDAVVEIKDAMDCRVPEFIQQGCIGSGTYYLSNPIDGQWHDTGTVKYGKPVQSCRDERAVTSFRHAVLESDEAAPDLWFGFIAQLPIKTMAIYTSGGKSIHCLFRVDAPSKQAWDELIAPLKRPAKVMGADHSCLSAVRLTRLPQCWRPEKSGFQRLLYLNPDPPLCPLVDMPVLFPRPQTLMRWRKLGVAR